ncbi:MULTISPECIES: KPN_02809 family neutral zinc metallopeptidase [unclassified Deinococcus]|jgi:predicted metalloprotease|uniref:KPN_02809 family neutral zinc metallopeptidase n=1 Tax=unclassified Deinococcus TaxID=2623546 RepID=UPI001C2FAC1F|nr:MULTISPECIES: neutral zinc metallopeptidase [unclassified Deinococcus]MDK2013431.1 neutral zinc metallopeptidase [Deinococcus sp. 43]
MDWKNLPGSGGNAENRGGGGLPGGGIAVGGVGGLIIALIAMFFGIDPGAILGGGGTQTQQSQTTQPAQNDEAYQFVNQIYRNTNLVWDNIFQQAGRTYNDPRLVRYVRGTSTSCGQANSAVGPFYCPADNTIYIDTSFFTQMDRQLGGGGDFAYAYVIAHEVGHHIQNELGIADQVNRRQRSARTEAEANSYSVRLELQADCFAGVWGNKTQQEAKITQADVQEAVATAEAIGDDNLQRQGQGYVAPDSFTHGSAAQRVQWFMTGFRSGNPNSCDTFNVNYNQL